ncbi:MAG: DUF3857 domain-containing protein [Xanthomonadales bacterium]|nr:DUF3857 domain-containing protein [Xanthomonadales bacterium]
MFGFKRIAASASAWKELVAVLGAIACAAMATDARSADYATRPTPAWVVGIERGVADPAAAGQVRDGLDYLLVDTQVRAIRSSRTLYRRMALRAVDISGVEGAANIEIGFDPSWQTLELHAIDLIRDGRVIDKLAGATVRVLQREAELERRIYDGRKTASVFLEDVRVGDTIDYAYSLSGRNPVFGGRDSGTFDLDHRVPVARIHARLLSDDAAAIRVATRNTALEPEITRDGALQSWRWRADRVAAVVVDDDAPSWHDPSAFVQWSTYADWNAVARWAVPLYAVTGQDDAELEREIARIAASESTADGRLLATLRFVQGEIRYLGIAIGTGSHAPNPPALVLERRFGDCKDKTLLMLAMLDRLGVDAQPAFVATELRRGLRDQLPSPGRFDHVLVRARIGDRTYWLDPTNPRQDAALDTLAQADFEFALVVADDSRGLVPMAPAGRAPALREIHATYDARAGFEQTVGYVVVTKLGAERAEGLRATVAADGVDALQKSYLNFYARYFPGIILASPLAIEDDLAANRVTVTERYSITDFSSLNEDGMTRSAVVETPDLDGWLSAPGSTVRTAPLWRAHPVDVGLTTEVLLGEDWPSESEPSTIDDPAFSYERTIKPRRGRLVIVDRYRSRTDEIPAADVPRYSANLARAREASGYVFSWPAQGGSTGGSDWQPNWMLAIVVGMAFALWLLAAARLHRIDPPARSAAVGAPSGLGGWLVLATLGLLVTPLVSIFVVWQTRDSWSLATWTAVSTPTSDSYSALAAPTLMISAIGLVGMFVMSILLLVIYFRRRTSVRWLYPAFLIGLFVWQLANLGLIGLLPNVKVDASDVADVVRGAFAALLWTLYFLRSQRVAATFTRRLAPSPPVPVPPSGSVPILG